MYQIEHYELADRHLVGLTLRAGSMVRVDHGRLWLTQPGQLQDVWLQAGESWTQATTGRVWLSAEPSARFQLAHPLLAGSVTRRLARPACASLRAWAGASPLWQHTQAPGLASLKV